MMQPCFSIPTTTPRYFMGKLHGDTLVEKSTYNVSTPQPAMESHSGMYIKLPTINSNSYTQHVMVISNIVICVSVNLQDMLQLYANYAQAAAYNKAVMNSNYAKWTLLTEHVLSDTGALLDATITLQR